MNDILEPYVKKALDAGSKGLEDICNFISTQAPELVKEIITWGVLSELCAPIVGLLLMIWVFIYYLKARKKETSFYNSKDSEKFPFGKVFTWSFFLVGLLIFLSQIGEVIYPLVAPRLYLLEKISTLVK